MRYLESALHIKYAKMLTVGGRGNGVMSADGDRKLKMHTKKVERLWPLQPLRFRRLCDHWEIYIQHL